MHYYSISSTNISGMTTPNHIPQVIQSSPKNENFFMQKIKECSGKQATPMTIGKKLERLKYFQGEHLSSSKEKNPRQAPLFSFNLNGKTRYFNPSHPRIPNNPKNPKSQTALSKSQPLDPEFPTTTLSTHNLSHLGPKRQITAGKISTLNKIQSFSQCSMGSRKNTQQVLLKLCPKTNTPQCLCCHKKSFNSDVINRLKILDNPSYSTSNMQMTNGANMGNEFALSNPNKNFCSEIATFRENQNFGNIRDSNSANRFYCSGRGDMGTGGYSERFLGGAEGRTRDWDSSQEAFPEGELPKMGGRGSRDFMKDLNLNLGFEGWEKRDFGGDVKKSPQQVFRNNKKKR
jgi:hypothetical protein